MPSTAICTVCNEKKSIHDFRKASGRKGGWTYPCKACHAEKEKVGRQKRKSDKFEAGRRVGIQQAIDVFERNVGDSWAICLREMRELL